MVERYLPHTSDDDDSRYRPPQELEEAKKRDPLKILSSQLTELGSLSPELDAEYLAEARRVVDEATDHVEGAPYPGTEGFHDHVYAGQGGAS